MPGESAKRRSSRRGREAHLRLVQAKERGHFALELPLTGEGPLTLFAPIGDALAAEYVDEEEFGDGDGRVRLKVDTKHKGVWTSRPHRKTQAGRMPTVPVQATMEATGPWASRPIPSV